MGRGLQRAYVDARATTFVCGVRVACSGDLNCDSASNTTTLTVDVSCPGTPPYPTNHFAQAIVFAADVARSALSWASATHVDAIRGDLDAPRGSGGNLTGTIMTCLANDVTTDAMIEPGANPVSGSARYDLVRPSGCGNQDGSHGTTVAGEAPGRDTEMAATRVGACRNKRTRTRASAVTVQPRRRITRTMRRCSSHRASHTSLK